MKELSMKAKHFAPIWMESWLKLNVDDWRLPLSLLSKNPLWDLYIGLLYPKIKRGSMSKDDLHEWWAKWEFK